MEVVNETWYKELDDPDIFYTNVTSLKLLNHLTELFWGINTVGAVDTPQLMKTLFTNTDGIPQFINAMVAAQRKSKLAKLIIQGKYMHAVELKFLLQSGEYETKTREWSKLPDDQQTWTAWEKKFREAYMANRLAKSAR